jgi:hypothetical protein
MRAVHKEQAALWLYGGGGIRGELRCHHRGKLVTNAVFATEPQRSQSQNLRPEEPLGKQKIG